MSDSLEVAKAPCDQCGIHIEFPVEMAGTTVDCPSCRQPTLLAVALCDPGREPEAKTGINIAELLAGFGGPVPKTRVSFFYGFGMLVVAGAMILLPLIYLAMIGLAGWGVFYWATEFSFLLTGGALGIRLHFLRLLLYFLPLFVGGVLVLFMIKPLFAGRPRHAQALAVNPGAEPALAAFVSRICQTVGAPFPKWITIDCQLNASAGFRGGPLNLFGGDLVLTIGMPLVAGLTIKELAGVLAHEFGHFTQSFGMRLTYIVRSINGWFARVVYERDAWDMTLEEWGETENGWVTMAVACAQIAVSISRLALTLLMYIGHGVGCFMLRQMEYNADSYEIKLAGSEAFETTTRRMHVLSKVLERAHKEMRIGWNHNRELPENFPAYLLFVDRGLPAEIRTRFEDTMGLRPSGIFDTHPSAGDRIRRARQAQEAGAFDFDGPATALFSDFDVPAKQVSALHYSEDLGLPLAMVRLVPLPVRQEV